MSEPTGYGDSPDTADGGGGGGGGGGDLIDGTPGNDKADAGAQDTELTTDDAAQREDSEARPGNTPD